ncbi:MAG: PCP reductase family protein [Myxococcota bacterium]|nr:PCP reductase family protein [Myxococcota bacterium]
MKFLCVSCDEAMKLIRTDPPERGSLTVVYQCPKCASEFAMLTNPYETQVVGSLGVKVDANGGAGESKCPFTGVVQDLGVGVAGSTNGLSWTSEASSSLLNIPEFARPMAKTGIEKFATERGFAQIDAQVLAEARNFFGM